MAKYGLETERTTHLRGMRPSQGGDGGGFRDVANAFMCAPSEMWRWSSDEDGETVCIIGDGIPDAVSRGEHLSVNYSYVFVSGAIDAMFIVADTVIFCSSRPPMPSGIGVA